MQEIVQNQLLPFVCFTVFLYFILPLLFEPLTLAGRLLRAVAAGLFFTALKMVFDHYFPLF